MERGWIRTSLAIICANFQQKKAQKSCDFSEYQGRLYESPTDGIFKAGTMQINEDMLKEYFSEGYRAFYQEPSALKEKDPQLYHFIEGLKNDQK